MPVLSYSWRIYDRFPRVNSISHINPFAIASNIFICYRSFRSFVLFVYSCWTLIRLSQFYQLSWRRTYAFSTTRVTVKRFCHLKRSWRTIQTLCCSIYHISHILPSITLIRPYVICVSYAILVFVHTVVVVLFSLLLFFPLFFLVHIIVFKFK